MEGRALGKGLSALITEKVDRQESVAELKTALIKDSSVQPRSIYDEEKLAELIASIKEQGVLQPILVREKEGSYEVIAGERRLRAARALNLEKVPVVIKSVSDSEALVLALIENIQREDLNAIEEAQAFKRLIEEFNITQEAVAQSVGKDRSTVTNLLRLLKLPNDIQKSVMTGKITHGHARALLSVEDSYEQGQIYEYILKNELSVRALESLIKTGLKSVKNIRRAANPEKKHSDVAALEEELQRILGSKVRIQPKKKRGKIVIEYYSLEDLKRIIQLIAK